VADHEQGNSQEPLTEREKKAIQTWAREFVREVSIHPDPEREAKLEGRKLEAEAMKTQVLISSGLLVGLAAVIRLLPKATLTWLLLFAFLFVLTSVIFGIWEMRAIAQKVRSQDASERWLPFEPVRAPLTYLAVGMLIFLIYLSYNIPGAEPENALGGIARVVLAVLAVLLVLVTGAIGRRILRWWWHRTEIERRIRSWWGQRMESNQESTEVSRAQDNGPATEAAEEGTQQRPWWRRLFGG
jgi:hypothetical protein